MKNKNLLKTISGLFISIFIIFVIIKKIIDAKNANKQEDRGNTQKEKKKTVKISSNISSRQDHILSLFDQKNKLYIEDIAREVRGVHVRTLRRELAKMAEMGLVSKIGETKGSYYTRN